MESTNCNCNEYPEATFMRDSDDRTIYVDSLFCPICFRQFVSDVDYTRNQYLEDKRKHKEIENEYR